MYYSPICDQRFIVLDESGSPIDNAEVIALKSVQTGFWRVTSTTTSDGGAVLTIDEGDTYTATAIKSGYTCVSCTKTFKPCIGKITFTLKETNMTYAHVYPHWKNPASNTEKDPGTYVQVYLQIRNDSNTAGYCYFGVNKNGAECGKHIYNVWLEHGAAKNLTTPCSFVMPNSRVTIEYFGGHADYIGPGGWHEDFSDTIYIDPKPPVVTYCNQTVRTVDQNGKGISARVHLTNSRNVYQNTDSLGYTTFTNLQENRTHYISAEKTGYSGDSDTFKACKGTITLTLGKTCYCGDWIPRECVREGVRRYTRTCVPPGCSTEERTVIDDTCLTKGILWVKSIPVQGADIYINNIKQTYKTNQDFDVNPGTYTVRASKTGYIEPSSQSVSIIAGQTKTLTFTLEEEAPPPPTCSEYTTEEECLPPCYWWSDGTCHDIPETPPPTCSDLPPEECVPPCFLWSDNTCHNIPEGIPNCSDYDNTSKEECEGHIGCYWWDVDSTCRNTSPDKTDTKLTWMAIPETTVVNEPVKLSVALERANIGGLDIEGKIIRFYANDVEIGSATTVEEHILVKAIAEIEYPFAEIGFYTIVAKFEEPDEEFNPSETLEEKIIEVKEHAPCDQGFRVTVKNIPEEGLQVWCKKTAIAWWKKSVTPDEPTVVFDKQDGLSAGAVTYIQVLTYDDYILDETDNIKAPSSGCNEVPLNGWNGCKWRILLTGPSEVSLNKSFQIKSTLFQIPSNIVSGDKQVEFYESDISGTPIWTDTTDEDGVALCTVPAKPTIGTYTYFAKYFDAPTFCEPLTGLNIKVVEKLEPEGIWESLIQFIVDTFDVKPDQAKIIAYTGIGLVSLLFLSSMFKR